MDDFDPNNLKRRDMIWATYFPDRKPPFKVYSNRGHALSSFMYRESGVLYNMIDDKWVEVYKLEPREERVTHCELCGEHEKYLTRKWFKENGLELIYVCNKCRKRL